MDRDGPTLYQGYRAPVLAKVEEPFKEPFTLGDYGHLLGGHAVEAFLEASEGLAKDPWSTYADVRNRFDEAYWSVVTFEAIAAPANR